MQVICLHKTRALSTANAAFAEAITLPHMTTGART